MKKKMLVAAVCGGSSVEKFFVAHTQKQMTEKLFDYILTNISGRFPLDLLPNGKQNVIKSYFRMWSAEHLEGPRWVAL